VSVEVTNTGGMAGEEVVQLYISFEDSKVDRPVKNSRVCEVHLLPARRRRSA